MSGLVKLIENIKLFDEIWPGQNGVERFDGAVAHSFAQIGVGRELAHGVGNGSWIGCGHEKSFAAVGYVFRLCAVGCAYDRFPGSHIFYV